MRYLVVDTQYSGLSAWLQARHPGIQERSWADQLDIRAAEFVVMADHYARHLRGLGHECVVVAANDPNSQRAWGQERGMSVSPRLRLTRRRGWVPWPAPATSWLKEVLVAQLRHYRADVVLVLDLFFFDEQLRSAARSYSPLLVGQHAATPLPEGDYRDFDAVFSSWPPTLSFLRGADVRAEPLALGFEPAVLEHLQEGPRDLPITFIGSFRRPHSSRITLIEALCREFEDITIWSPDGDRLPRNSPIRRVLHPGVWGKEMYSVLRRSRLTINHHGDVAPHSNNMRLFEATGVGATLLTEHTADLNALFQPGKEVVAYRDANDCVGKIMDLLARPDHAEEIGRSGQARTLEEHTWGRRVLQLNEVITSLPRRDTVDR